MEPFLIALLCIVAAVLYFAMNAKKSAPKATRTFNPILDNYKTLEEAQKALRTAGLESSQLVVGIDYTKSNTWQGRRTYGGRCLHEMSKLEKNPYQCVLDVLGRTLEAFDDDGQIPAFGFGDAQTGDHSVFRLGSGDCDGLPDLLGRYSSITPTVSLSGPTSFAPIIREAIKIVQETREYHILVIIADGQVSNERETVNAIVEASNFALSIVMVGVGDGPWDRMNDFDDGLPARRFDNFQFVDFHSVMAKHGSDAAFALSALMEIPDQYKAIRNLHLLGKNKDHVDIVD